MCIRFGQNPLTHSGVNILTGRMPGWTHTHTRTCIHGCTAQEQNASVAPIDNRRRHKNITVFPGITFPAIKATEMLLNTNQLVPALCP